MVKDMQIIKEAPSEENSFTGIDDWKRRSTADGWNDRPAGPSC